MITLRINLLASVATDTGFPVDDRVEVAASHAQCSKQEEKGAQAKHCSNPLHSFQQTISTSLRRALKCQCHRLVGEYHRWRAQTLISVN